MKSYIHFFAIALLSPFGVTQTRAAESGSLIPFAPTELIQVLPQATDDWTLTRSDAETTFGNWLQTRATRTFHPVSKSADAPAKGEIEISVIDTGRYPSSLAPFADFHPGKLGPIEHLLIGGYPAIQVPDPSGYVLTQVLLASRYIVEVKITDLSNQKVDAWLRQLHFEALPRQTAAPGAALPRDLRLTSIDELHPERNRSYAVSVSRQ